MIDERPLVRRGIQACLEESGVFTVVGSTSVLPEPDLVRDLQPDLLVAAIALATGGIEPVRQVRVALPVLPLLLLAEDDRLVPTAELQRLGVCGYLPLTATCERVLATLQALVASPTLVRTHAREADAWPPARLTPRERQVLQLLAAGRRSKEIARVLDISLGTVRFHEQHACDKLRARSRAQLIAEAVRRGLIDPGRLN